LAFNKRETSFGAHLPSDNRDPHLIADKSNGCENSKSYGPAHLQDIASEDLLLIGFPHPASLSERPCSDRSEFGPFRAVRTARTHRAGAPPESEVRRPIDKTEIADPLLIPYRHVGSMTGVDAPQARARTPGIGCDLFNPTPSEALF
jgi:hypothetical protein